VKEAKGPAHNEYCHNFQITLSLVWGTYKYYLCVYYGISMAMNEYAALSTIKA